MLGDGQLGIATAPSREQLPKFEVPGGEGAAAVAQQARRRPVEGSAAWIFINPPALEAAMEDPPPGWVNLTLFARAFASAREAFVIISEAPSESGAGEIHIFLRADCASAAEAEQLQSLLASLNRFAAAAINMGKSEQEHSPWSAVLSDSRFVQTGDVVEGLWVVPLPLIMQASWESIQP
jgi:hypothetical protein